MSLCSNKFWLYCSDFIYDFKARFLLFIILSHILYQNILATSLRTLNTAPGDIKYTFGTGTINECPTAVTWTLTITSAVADHRMLTRTNWEPYSKSVHAQSVLKLVSFDVPKVMLRLGSKNADGNSVLSDSKSGTTGKLTSC